MLTRKSLLSIIFGLFVLVSVQPAKAISPSISNLVTRSAALVGTAFGVNLAGYYSIEKLLYSKTKHKHLRNALIGAIGAAMLMSDICILRTAVTNKFWD